MPSMHLSGTGTQEQPRSITPSQSLSIPSQRSALGPIAPSHSPQSPAALHVWVPAMHGDDTNSVPHSRVSPGEQTHPSSRAPSQSWSRWSHCSGAGITASSQGESPQSPHSVPSLRQTWMPSAHIPTPRFTCRPGKHDCVSPGPHGQPSSIRRSMSSSAPFPHTSLRMVHASAASMLTCASVNPRLTSRAGAHPFEIEMASRMLHPIFSNARVGTENSVRGWPK